MVKITRTCFLGHYLLRYDMMRVREAEKTSDLRILQGPQKYVYCGKRSAGSCIARRMVEIALQTDSIADPPILSSSAENGSATAMQGRF